MRTALTRPLPPTPNGAVVLSQASVAWTALPHAGPVSSLPSERGHGNVVWPGPVGGVWAVGTSLRGTSGQSGLAGTLLSCCSLDLSRSRLLCGAGASGPVSVEKTGRGAWRQVWGPVRSRLGVRTGPLTELGVVGGLRW